MNDLIRLLLEAEISKESIENIKSQLEEIEKTSSAIKIKIDIDKNILKDISDLNKRLDTIIKTNTKVDSSNFKSMATDISLADKALSDFKITTTKTFKDADDKVYKHTETIKQFGEATTKVYEDIEKKKLKTTIIDDKTEQENVKRKIKNAKEELDLINKMADAREKSNLHAIESAKKLEETQAKYSNKAKDDDYKQRLKNEEILQKKRQEASDYARQLAYEDEQERLKVTTDIQARIERMITNSNENIAQQQSRMNKEDAHKNEAMWVKLLEEQAVKAKTLKGVYSELIGEQKNASNVAKVLSEEYGGLEVRGMSLNKVNGQYSVTLKQSAKENLVLKGTIDQVTGALRVQSEQVVQARNVQLGFWEQMKIALERVPKLQMGTLNFL